MTASAPPPSDIPSERLEGARVADLAELLGHVTTSWDDQRRLLARQLHDSLGSSMTALTMHLALLTQQLPQEKALLDRSAQMKQLLTTIINNNREMQLALWNDKLEFLGIKAAIVELAAGFGASHNITARVSLPEEDASYPRLQAVALLRGVEEGLCNVASHARASEVDVILDDDGGQVMLTVRDNGVGIEPGALANAAVGAGPGCHHGLRTLRERAAYLGGRLSVGRSPQGQGTTLTLVLPRDPVSAA
ncbi:MAG: histidine kinase [Massilia sp.]|nr:histidine kinase [Massilia sp.]